MTRFAPEAPEEEPALAEPRWVRVAQTVARWGGSRIEEPEPAPEPTWWRRAWSWTTTAATVVYFWWLVSEHQYDVLEIIGATLALGLLVLVAGALAEGALERHGYPLRSPAHLQRRG